MTTLTTTKPMKQTLIMSQAPASIPFMERTGAVHTLHAQKVIERVCRHTITAMYQLDTILRIIGDDNQADMVIAQVQDLLEKLDYEMDSEKARVKQILRDNAVQETPAYTNPVEVVAQVTSPQADKYFAAVLTMDEIVRDYHKLWFASVFTGRQRSGGEHGLARRLEKLGRRIIQLRGRAMSAARRAGKEEEVKGVLPDLEKTDIPAEGAEEEGAAGAQATDGATAADGEGQPENATGDQETKPKSRVRRSAATAAEAPEAATATA